MVTSGSISDARPAKPLPRTMASEGMSRETLRISEAVRSGDNPLCMISNQWELEACGMVNEVPWQFESAREMFGKGFNPESFGCVMASVKDVHAKFFGQRIRPVRALTGDERVDAFLGRLL